MGACGLKLRCHYTVMGPCCVTPYGGVWIEMSLRNLWESTMNVTPYGGVWIEIWIVYEIFVR